MSEFSHLTSDVTKDDVENFENTILKNNLGFTETEKKPMNSGIGTSSIEKILLNLANAMGADYTTSISGKKVTLKSPRMKHIGTLSAVLVDPIKLIQSNGVTSESINEIINAVNSVIYILVDVDDSEIVTVQQRKEWYENLPLKDGIRLALEFKQIINLESFLNGFKSENVGK